MRPGIEQEELPEMRIREHLINGMKHALPVLSTILLTLSFSATADDTWPSQAAGAQAAGFTEQGINRLDAAMEKIVNDNDVAGMVWLLAKDGVVATFDTQGYNALETQTPMELDSLFRIYSMTKPVTGVALMILHERGLWNFDDPVSKYVPELADLSVMTSYDDNGRVTTVPVGREPTMRELLNHSAGFGYGLSGRDPVNTAFRETRVLASDDLDQLIDKVKDIPLLFQPGEQWFYSIAVDIQGYIVQQIAGMKFGDFLQKEIFQPLAMSDTRFFVQEEDHERLAQIHSWDRGRNKLAQRTRRSSSFGYFDPSRIESGGDGLVSSTHDYARFLQMLVNEGELDGQRILTPESVRIMRTNSLRDELNIRQTDTDPGTAGEGFGVDFAVIYDPAATNSPQSAGTYYWSGAGGTWFWIDPIQDMFFIGMVQSMGTSRPGEADKRIVARDIIYASLAD
jgi:CubicO group peptidase (beta-lactamase class C family)